MQSTKIDTTNKSVWYYQYQWWLPTQTGDFMAQGILGQYIYVHPEKNLIIVRPYYDIKFISYKMKQHLSLGMMVGMLSKKGILTNVSN